MKPTLWLAMPFGLALTLGAQPADATRTRAQDRTQQRDQTQTQSRLRKQDGSCGQTPGTRAGQGQRSTARSGRIR